VGKGKVAESYTRAEGKTRKYASLGASSTLSLCCARQITWARERQLNIEGEGAVTLKGEES